MSGAALAAPLRDATRAAHQSVQVLCTEARARVEAAQDHACSERQPALEAIAAHVDGAKRNVNGVHQQLQAFCAQLEAASKHIQQLQDTSTFLEKQLEGQAADAAELSAWLRTAALAPSVVRTVAHTPIEGDVVAWVHATQSIEAQLRLLNEQHAARAPAVAPATARAQIEAVAQQAKTAVGAELLT